jgi:hypothetical protein
MTGAELAYRQEIKQRWNVWTYWRERGWTRLPSWVKRKRATLKLRGHPCQGCCTVAVRGEIDCPLLGEKLARLRSQAMLMKVAWEYYAGEANLVPSVPGDGRGYRYIPANLCRTIRRKAGEEAERFLSKKVHDWFIAPAWKASRERRRVQRVAQTIRLVVD